MKIDKPGIYRDIDVDAYHADPCPTPSLSQSMAKLLIDRAPLHVKTVHPRLSDQPVVDDEYKKAKAIGDAAHALMIGRGKDLAIGKFDSWRTKEAQLFKSVALDAGKTPILQEHFDEAHAILRAAQTQLDRHEAMDCFKVGSGEVALIWKEGPLWFRCLVDWLHDDLLGAEDFKTTSMSVAPHVIGTLAANAGWDIQAAMILRGLDALDPENAGRRTIRFVAQEQDAPWALSVVLMTNQWITMGQKKLNHAIEIWRHCIETNKWPGYPPFNLTPEYPGFREKQWLEREIEHHENAIRSDVAEIMRAG